MTVWPSLAPQTYALPRADTLPFPLGQPSCALFARARHALWQGVQALGLRRGDEVLAPAYHHGSEIQALLEADLTLRFYDAGPELEPDPGELDELLGDRTRALYLTHYLGFPRDAPRWRAWCDERGLLLLEDAGQAWTATIGDRPVGSFGDLGLFCLYKTVGVPDGAALVMRDGAAPGPEAQPRRGLEGIVRRHAAWALERSPTLWAPAAQRNGRRPYRAEEDFALGDPSQPPAASTVALLARLSPGHAAERRRAHYRLLADELGEQIPAPYRCMPEGAAPFALPVETPDKRALLDRLSAHGVRGLDLWPEPHPALPAARFPAAAHHRERTVCLPLHQGLRAEHLDRVLAGAAASPRRTTKLAVEELSSLEAVRESWDDLALRSGNVFASWEWATAWWRHFGAGRRLHLLGCRAGGRLVAILPLYRFADRPWRIVRFIGHGPADQLGPICGPADRPAVARALRSALADIDADLFLAEQLPREESWGGMFGGRTLSSEGSPVLRFDGRTWDEVLTASSSNLRRQLPRLERKLLREHGLRYRLCGGPADLDAGMDDLFALHAARWPDGASSFAGAHAAFHRDFARLALRRGWLRLWFLEADGRPVAAWHGFRFGDAESYYQAGRDPTWQGPTVGSVLLAHTIRTALEDGMREYRFLRGGEAFKYRFANADRGLETVAVTSQPLARAASAASAALPKELLQPLRDWLTQ